MQKKKRTPKVKTPKEIMKTPKEIIGVCLIHLPVVSSLVILPDSSLSKLPPVVIFLCECLEKLSFIFAVL